MSPYREPAAPAISIEKPPIAWRMSRHLRRAWSEAWPTALVVTIVPLTLLAGCAALNDAFFGPSAPIVNPADDADLYHCRMLAEIDHDMSHDAGGACRIYDRCVIDAGLRGDVGFCTSVQDGGAHD